MKERVDWRYFPCLGKPHNKNWIERESEIERERERNIYIYIYIYIYIVTWYATERGKGRSITLPFCVWINRFQAWPLTGDMNESQFLALYDLQLVEQRKESRSLEHPNRMEWWEKEKVKWLAHRPNAIFFISGNLEKNV